MRQGNKKETIFGYVLGNIIPVDVILGDIYLGCIIVSAIELIIGGSAKSKQDPRPRFCGNARSVETLVNLPHGARTIRHQLLRLVIDTILDFVRTLP